MGIGQFLWLIAGFVNIVVIAKKYNGFTYDGWSYIRIGINSTGNPNSEYILEEFVDDISRNKNIRLIELQKGHVYVVVDPLLPANEFQNILDRFGLKQEKLHNDIGKLLTPRDKERKVKRAAGSRGVDLLQEYLTWEEMETYFDYLADSYPNKVKKEVIGLSFEGRNIYKFTVSSRGCAISRGHGNSRRSSKLRKVKATFQEDPVNVARRRNQDVFIKQIKTVRNATHNIALVSFIPFTINSTVKSTASSSVKRRSRPAQKPVIFLDGGSHSREWISPAATIYLIRHLAENPKLTQNLDWQIVPMVNPDGYVYSWSTDRFWRKTRSNTSVAGCHGADINRNFGHHWREVDTSRYPCYEHYGGASEFSEAETAALRDTLLKEKGRLKAYISVHNWGQDIVYPYSYSKQQVPSTETELSHVSEGVVNAISRSGKIKYKNGPAAVLLYPASGTAIDWVYDTIEAPLAFLFELRDSDGTLGFLLSEKFIIPTSEDLVAAMAYIASVVENSSTTPRCS